MDERMHYIFKNNRLEETIFMLFNKEAAIENINLQMKDILTDHIFLSNNSPYDDQRTLENVQLPENIDIVISFPKSEISKVLEYSPYFWNPYPQLKPPVRGKYLIQIPDSSRKIGFYVDLLGWDGSESVEKTWDLMKVVAFMKVPDFYYPKDE